MRYTIHGVCRYCGNEEKEVNMYIDKNRRTGRTTRQIDNIIQTLFNSGEAHIAPHYFEGAEQTRNNNRESERMLRIVMQRLQLEHGIYSESVNIDKKNWSIKLINK